MEKTLDDKIFLSGCGVVADSDEAKLALAIRATISEQYHVPYEKVVPELQWKKFKPSFKSWCIVDYWKYLESIMEKFRDFDLRAEDDSSFSFPYKWIAGKNTVRDFVTSLIDVFDRYEHLADYLPPLQAAKISTDWNAIPEQLKSRYVLLQGGTPAEREKCIAGVVEHFSTEYTVCRFPDGIKEKQDYWDAMHSFRPMGPCYEVKGESGLDMASDYFERRRVIDQRPDKMLFVWEEVSPAVLFLMLGFILEDYYEMAWLRKPEKIRFLISLSEPVEELPKVELKYSDTSVNSYCPDLFDSDDFSRRVMIICDLDTKLHVSRGNSGVSDTAGEDCKH